MAPLPVFKKLRMHLIVAFFKSSFRRIYWRLRSRLGFRYGGGAELQYRLNHLLEPEATSPKFSFHWGDIEYVSASDLRGQFGEIFVDRHYAFRSAVPAPVIIDAGGNIGMSAIWFKQNYPQSILTVYEADPKLTPLLKRNLAAARITDVNVQNAAVWVKDGAVAFDNKGKDMGMVNSNGAIQVPSIDLAKRLPERVELLKLDIEGAEYPVIEHLCSNGAINRIRNLVAEFHIRRSDTDNFTTALRQLRESGMQVALTAALGPWLGETDVSADFEIVGRKQILAEVYAWR